MKVRRVASVGVNTSSATKVVHLYNSTGIRLAFPRVHNIKSKVSQYHFIFILVPF